jgi:hypothetical protein
VGVDGLRTERLVETGLAARVASSRSLRTPQSSKRPSQRILTSSKKCHRAGSTAPVKKSNFTARTPSTRRLHPTHWLISTQDRTINFLEAPVTELLIGATAVSLSLMEIQRQIIELGTREADYSVLFLAATRMLKAFLAVLRSTRMALRGYKSYAVIKKGENVYLKKIPATDDDAGVV